MLILTGKRGYRSHLNATQWVKGVSSTLILGGVEKKLLRLRAMPQSLWASCPIGQRVEYCWELPFAQQASGGITQGIGLVSDNTVRRHYARDFPLPVPARCPHKQCIAILCYGNQLMGWINCKVGRRRPIPTQAVLVQCLLEKNRRSTC